MTVLCVCTVSAGIVAAITAAQNGAKVTLLEKEAKISGNSAKATSGINFVGALPSFLMLSLGGAQACDAARPAG